METYVKTIITIHEARTNEAMGRSAHRSSRSPKVRRSGIRVLLCAVVLVVPWFTFPAAFAAGQLRKDKWTSAAPWQNLRRPSMNSFR